MIKDPFLEGLVPNASKLASSLRIAIPSCTFWAGVSDCRAATRDCGLPATKSDRDIGPELVKNYRTMVTRVWGAENWPEVC